jgi:hypothetical protein
MSAVLGACRGARITRCSRLCARTQRTKNNRYTRPCIMDLKMGVRTAEATAPLQKRVRMKAADILTSCQSDGVQLIAMSVYQRSQHKQVKTSKKAVRAPCLSPSCLPS